MDLRNIPEDVVKETLEYKCLQSQFSLLYNESLGVKTQLDEARALLLTAKNAHLRQIEHMEVNFPVTSSRSSLITKVANCLNSAFAIAKCSGMLYILTWLEEVGVCTVCSYRSIQGQVFNPGLIILIWLNPIGMKKNSPCYECTLCLCVISAT